MHSLSVIKSVDMNFTKSYFKLNNVSVRTLCFIYIWSWYFHCKRKKSYLAKSNVLRKNNYNNTSCKVFVEKKNKSTFKKSVFCDVSRWLLSMVRFSSSLYCFTLFNRWYTSKIHTLDFLRNYYLLMRKKPGDLIRLG